MEVAGSSRYAVGFLDIPLELRHLIYRHCLLRKHPIALYKISNYQKSCNKSGICDEKNSLARVSKQVGSEALDVLYGDNVFQTVLHGHGGPCLLNHLSENRHRIRKIQVVLQPWGYSHDRLLDSTLWFPIFAGLTKLTIVAQNPLEVPEHYRICSSEQAMQQWTAWARSVLQYIVPQLSNSCIIEADHGDRNEMSVLMKECLATGYRGVHTFEGDLFFRRFEFNAKSSH